MILVAGCGSIGQRHLRNLRRLGVEQLVAYDPIAERLNSVVREYQVAPCPDFEAGLARRPEAVLVCAPPHRHTDLAQAALAAGADVFIEKPMSHTMDGTAELLQLAEANSRVVSVGYNLRFHQGLLKLKELLDSGRIGNALVIRAEMGQYLPDWRPGADYRHGYNAHAEMGGGILLDASHEIDYVRWLGGEVERVYCAAEHLSSLETDTEDIALITLRLAHGILASVHVDCIQRAYSRSCKIIGDQGTLVWNFTTGVEIFSPDGARTQVTLETDINDMYLAEMRHFLDCVARVAQPRVDGATGQRVLSIALAAKRSAELGQEVSVFPG